jgi:hypothetical protein
MEPIGTLLFKIYRGTPQHADWMVACMQGAWPALVGEKLAQVCRPCAFSKSTLTIEIMDPDWEGALRSTKTELLEKLRLVTEDEVRHLSFKSPPPRR